MSCESDLDNELSRLRNELLLGLGKRIVAKSAQQQQDREKTDETSIRAEKEEANGRDDEGQDDLEQLRSEALNAKRAKEQKYERPGRFRYDIERESDHEDDDYYDELLITHNDSDHDDEPTEEAARHVKTTTNGVEEAAMSAEQHSTNNCHRTNYEAYRLECSRHMAAHEIYEPSSESVVDDLHRMRSRVLEQNSHDDDDDDDYDDTNRTKRLKSVVVVKVNYTNSSTWKETTHSHRHRHDHTSSCRYDQHSSSSGSTSSSRRRRKYSNMSPYSNR